MKPLSTIRQKGAPALALAIAAMLLLAGTAKAGPFSTFVSSSSINAVEQNTSVIAYNYAGDKFVGSVYFGNNNSQLFSTDLNGGNVQKYGTPIPGATGEVVLGVSLGQGGFSTYGVFAGSQSNTQIYSVPASGTPTLFTTLPTGGDIRQIAFDTGGLFGNDMIVTTGSGDIYKVDSAGHATKIASVGEDTEGVDVVTSAWGKYAGWLAVSSEGSGKLRLIGPNGQIVDTGISLGLMESVNFVPLNLGASGNPLEGLYVANYPENIQKADASAFAGHQGDAIVSQEFGGNAPFSYVHYDAGADSFSVQSFGNISNQAEDAIFVTAQRLAPAAAPEPSSLVLLGMAALSGAAYRGWRRRKPAA